MQTPDIRTASPATPTSNEHARDSDTNDVRVEIFYTNYYNYYDSFNYHYIAIHCGDQESW